MAEGFEPYHVPQQSRRDKLRVFAQTHHDNLQGFLPLYDPSLLPADLLTCGNCGAAANSEACKSNPNCVKHEGMNLMGYAGGFMNINPSSASSSTHHHYLDPQSSMPINNDINPFFYNSPQNFRDFAGYSGGGGGDVLYKPEPLSLTTTGQGLSLSLSSHSTHQSNHPLELNIPSYESAIFNQKISRDGGGYIFNRGNNVGDGSGSISNDVSRSTSLGPFTGYASILKGSKFLRPAQQLLDEFCHVGREIYADRIAATAAADMSFMDPCLDSLSGSSGILDSCEEVGDQQRHKSKLISMLDEVYRRYRQYYQQIQAVVASFESVAGLNNAAPFANLALKAMSKNFSCLKNVITDQLHFTNKTHGHVSHRKDEDLRFSNTDRGYYSQRPAQNSGFFEQQPVWRPQRGLPERAVAVLRAWLFEHFLHPYPTDTDKLMLAKQTGLSRNQVSNWFINARVRLWKPMVEEIHMLETRQAQKTPQKGEEQNENRSSDQMASSNSLASENPSTSTTQRFHDVPSKRTRTELADIPSVGSVEPMNLSYNHLSSHPPLGVGVYNQGGGSSNVSLTLGLHQNNGIGLSDTFPISASQRLGLGFDSNNDGYIMGGYESQSRHFGRDVIGGQLLHDFVG